MSQKTVEKQGPLEPIGIRNALWERRRGRLLTTKQASEYLGVTIWTIRKLIWDNKIPVVRFDDGARKFFLDIKDLDELIEGSKTFRDN